MKMLETDIQKSTHLALYWVVLRVASMLRWAVGERAAKGDWGSIHLLAPRSAPGEWKVQATFNYVSLEMYNLCVFEYLL